MRLPLATAAAAALALAACSDSPTAPTGPTPPRGILVLNGFGQQGLTVVGDTGTTTARVAFDNTFDGGGMEVARDTVISTSSAFGGNKLYVANLVAGTATTVQLPANSDPAGATFTGGLGSASVAVALRSTQALALVQLGAAPTVTTIAGVGRCPADVGVQGGSFWILDSNRSCESSFASLGDSRLIRLAPNGAGARDTILLPGVKSATGIVVVGSTAFVSSGGVADFSARPVVRFVEPAKLVKVDLAARRVVRTVDVAPTSNGGGARLGADGRLYFATALTTDYNTRAVFAFDQELTPVGTRVAGGNQLALRLADGSAPKCVGAVGDALGRVYCAVNGAGSAATLYAFDATGALLRTVAAGQGAVDVALR